MMANTPDTWVSLAAEDMLRDLRHTDEVIAAIRAEGAPALAVNRIKQPISEPKG